MKRNTNLNRSIVDRLIYNNCYQTIDENITDHNVSTRKNRNICDNIFVLGADVNSVVNGKDEPIQIQVGDVENFFDKLWLQATTNALYESELNNDMLNLLYLDLMRKQPNDNILLGPLVARAPKKYVILFAIVN